MRVIAPTLAAALLLAACGTRPTFEQPACRQLYDACTDACADRCEAPASRYGPDDSRRPPTLHEDDMMGSSCAACVSACRERAERCDVTVPEAP